MNVLQRAALFAAIGVAALVALGGDSPGAQASHSATSAIISNGTVQLGVWDTGNLNAPGGTASCEDGTTVVGLRFVPTNCDSTSPGCTCEGWGAADAVSNTSGYANDDEGGDFNMTVESFTSNASSAVSTVMLTNGLRVTHDYHPSTATPNLYEVVVTIQNTSAAGVHLLYRRVMDWDIEPTPFDEFVTMNPGTVSALVFTSNDGFTTADPLGGPSDIGFTGAFVDAGPDDHGALFDFDFGMLPPGFSKRIVTFYGAAPTEVGALAALTAVGAEAYSLGQPSGGPSEGDGPVSGTPNTFMFAFGKVDSVVFETAPPAPEPTATPKACIPPLVGIICTAPAGGGGSRPTATATAGTPTTIPPTSVPPTQAAPAQTQPSGGQAGVIRAPDTGDGSGTAGGGNATLTLLVLAASGIALAGAGAGALKLQARRRD